jgi:hypothetical protein
MKRLLLALTGGIIIPIILFGVTFFLTHILELDQLEWLAYLLLLAVVWPLKIFDPLFPTGGMKFVPSNEALSATVICDVLVYSLLTYLVLWWRARKKSAR